MRLLANLTSIIFLLLTILVCVLTSIWLSGRADVPTFLAPEPTLDIPTPILRATRTPTLTFTPSITPTITRTWTPSPTWSLTPTQTATATATSTMTSTPTDTPTNTPSSTPTPITPSATFTPTLTATVTLTPTNAPPTATVAPFAFVVSNVRPRQSLSGTCEFAGFGGQILDLNQQPLTGIQVVVKGPSLPPVGSTAVSGLHPTFGQGGWEIQVAQSPVVNTYTVQLQAIDGTPLSDEIRHTFSGQCSENLLLLTFRQVRDY